MSCTMAWERAQIHESEASCSIVPLGAGRLQCSCSEVCCLLSPFQCARYGHHHHHHHGPHSEVATVPLRGSEEP
eukprot:6315646-Amphidinium_carterae.1